MWKTGHSLIKSKMKETGAPLAGEMTRPHLLRRRLLRLRRRALRRDAADRGLGRGSASRSPSCTSALPGDGQHTRAALPGRRKPQIRRDRRSRRALAAARAPRSTRIDGVRVTTADGWWLLRASNTQDVTCRPRRERQPKQGSIACFTRSMSSWPPRVAAGGAQAGHQKGARAAASPF